jgi:hypothetical protein
MLSPPGQMLMLPGKKRCNPREPLQVLASGDSVTGAEIKAVLPEDIRAEPSGMCCFELYHM